MNEQLNFDDQENANQIPVISNEKQLNNDDKSLKRKQQQKHWTPHVESWLIFG